MAKITGIGGVFFKCEDPKALKIWYNEMLGINTDEYGCSFMWKDDNDPERPGMTVWSPFKKDTTYFEPSTKEFMINFRVDNLFEYLGDLAKKGIMPVGEIQEEEYGNFAWIMDLEGNKLELWQPKIVID